MTTKIDVAKLPIQSWPIEKALPHPQNAKKHSDEKTALLAKSIASQGIANPIQVEPETFADGEVNKTPFVIIAGHGRQLAARSLDWKNIPVIVRVDLTRAQCAALRISDNTTVSQDYDTELLREGLNELNVDGFDLSTLGFDDKSLSTLISDFGAMDDDVFAEDITEAVETQKAENKAKEAEIDASAAPVSDALGFKRLTIEQSRKVREFMTRIETSTGLAGAAALVAHIEGLAA